MVIMDYSALQDGEGTPCFPPSHPPTPLSLVLSLFSFDGMFNFDQH